MEKYLITGAAGYIGSMLLRCPDQIRIHDIQSRGSQTRIRAVRQGYLLEGA